MNQQNIDALCNHCGQALTAFLTEMAEHNEKVLCPSCGKVHEVKPKNVHDAAASAR